MKRSMRAVLLLAGLAGCKQATTTPTPPVRPQTSQPPLAMNNGVPRVGPSGRASDGGVYQMPDGTSVGPAVYTSRGVMPGPVNNAMYYAPPNAPAPVTLTSGWLGLGGSSQPASTSSPGCANGNCDGAASGPSHPGLAHNPPAPEIPTFHGGKGILPPPGMAPAGAVAAVGALPEMPPGPMFTGRSEVRFAEPVGMKVSWYGPSGWEGIPLETPAKYNFLQGGIYRLRLSAIPTRAGVTLYPTIQVFPGTAKSEAFLAHSSIPLNFSDEDFEQVGSGNYLVKVIYLPDPTYQDLAVVAGAHEMTFTRLEPGIDPVVEASKRGTVLLVVRMGNIDLQDPNTPAMDAPPPYPMPPGGGYPAGPAPVPGGPIVAPPLSNRGAPTTATPTAMPKPTPAAPGSDSRPNTLPLQ